ncbi:MAG TPA: sulfotransferase [Thermodesulfobacteriota bacterium]
MPLPNFLIIGAQKSGTSYFAKILSQHPDIFVYKSEIHFFDKSKNYKKGIAWYKEHFPSYDNYKFIGEKTPDYLWANGNGAEGHLSNVHKNLFHHLPHAKLIILLRNPVSRAISAVNHIIRTGRISPLHNIDQLLIGNKAHLIEGHGIISKGMYYQQIKSYLEFFDRRQLLLLIYEEDLIMNSMSGLKKVCNFLGADSNFSFTNLKNPINYHNRSRISMVADYYAPQLKRYTKWLDKYFRVNKLYPSDQTIKELNDIYTEPNQMFFEFIGRKIQSWQSHLSS